MKLKVLLICLCSLLLSAGGFGQKRQAPLVLKTLTKRDNGKTVVLRVAQFFNVVFTKECVGCRYVWTNTVIDSTKIRFLSNTYSDKSCKDCTGGTQTNTFHFKVIKKGKSRLSFTYFENKYTVNIVAK